jgi:hypothetical protein
MKRIQDKIKDLVEPQSFEQVGNYADDPAQALAAYRFTDVTSDLLARLLDALADLPRGSGTARALAGARGVGKSHTLAVFGALSGSERLRASVEDGHVSASARRLAGRRFAVVRVERGTRPTLGEELTAAFVAFFGGSETQWGRDPAEMLAVAASRAMDETLVVIIDTAFDRPARVTRDDGPLLGALAVMAHNVNVFLALALDDDIAGADGANVALAGTYQIDYLDPENLYRVAEQFVLRKRPQVTDTLREIYQSLRATVPDFNWSQARFACVYPVHPLVAEVSSGVRHFVPSFAFLPFAATAAARATTRPALSLVLLDEVFDATEAELRKSAELRLAFAAYDHLTERCIGQLPIMQRYQARLILKSLFVLSLEGRGATPREMCAALLLTDETGSENAPRQVGEAFARFADTAAPGSLDETVEADGETRYRFHINVPEALYAARDVHAVRQTESAAPKLSESDSRPHDEAAAPARVEEARATGMPESAVATYEKIAEPFALEDARTNVAAAVGSHAEVSFGDLSVEESSSPVEEGSGGASEELESSAVEGFPPVPEELVEWARMLTARAALFSAAGSRAREEVRAALAGWLEGWRGLALRRKFEALPDDCLTTRVWKAEAEVRKSFGQAASALETVLAGKASLEEGLARVAEAFGDSPETFARRARTLENLTEFVEGLAGRERVRAYLAAAEQTSVDEIETARRELQTIAEDSNNFLEAERRERFDRLWREFRARYVEHYADVHDKTVGAREVRESLQLLQRGERWREFESLSRLPVVSTQVWRQAEDLLRLASDARCDLPVRRLLEGRPACACRFRLAQAAELEELPQELDALTERGLAVYRRTLLMLAGTLAISLDALARRETDEEETRRARALSTTFAQGHVPARFSRQDVRLVERALRRMAAPPPVRVVAPNGDAGLLTREELRARFDQWLDELPEQPVLIEVVSKAEINAP